jgi:hypothetical protein
VLGVYMVISNSVSTTEINKILAVNLTGFTLQATSFQSVRK